MQLFDMDMQAPGLRHQCRLRHFYVFRNKYTHIARHVSLKRIHICRFQLYRGYTIYLAEVVMFSSQVCVNYLQILN